MRKVLIVKNCIARKGICSRKGQKMQMWVVKKGLRLLGGSEAAVLREKLVM